MSQEEQVFRRSSLMFSASCQYCLRFIFQPISIPAAMPAANVTAVASIGWRFTLLFVLSKNSAPMLSQPQVHPQRQMPREKPCAQLRKLSRPPVSTLIAPLSADLSRL
jgi:hypothetical protein